MDQEALKDKWSVVCASMNARGTSKIASDYALFLERVGYRVEIVRPRLSRYKAYEVLWEIAGLYRLRLGNSRKIVVVNGRISPLVSGKRLDILLVTLDMMNCGWRKVWSRDMSLRERMNVMINTLLVRSSHRKARWRSVISKKSREDIEANGIEQRESQNEARIIYPTGSFATVTDGLWRDVKIKADLSDGDAREVCCCLWITGETKNKAYTRGVETLERLKGIGVKMEVEILGIKREELKVDSKRKMGSNDRVSLEFLGRLSESRLIERYLGCDISLCLSEEEGFGLPFLDSVLFGIPIVAYKIDTYIEICRHVESAGLDLPPIAWIGEKGIDATEICSDRIEKVKRLIVKGLEEKEARKAQKRIEMYQVGCNRLTRVSSGELERLVKT